MKFDSIRRSPPIAVCAAVLALWAGTGFAASGSDTAYLNLEVQESVTCSLTWGDLSETTSRSIPAGSVFSDTMDLTCVHNMAASQTFSLAAMVDKTSGPVWEEAVTLYDGAEVLVWREADFGTLQVFSTSLGGSGDAFSQPLDAEFQAIFSQEAGFYDFSITVTVTSL